MQVLSASEGLLHVENECACVQPLTGIALKPPVPQPQLIYRPGTGVGPMMGLESCTTSTMPAHCRSSCRRLNDGNSASTAAMIACLTAKLPRWAYDGKRSSMAPMTISPLSDWLTYAPVPG